MWRTYGSHSRVKDCDMVIEVLPYAYIGEKRGTSNWDKSKRSGE